MSFICCIMLLVVLLDHNAFPCTTVPCFMTLPWNKPRATTLHWPCFNGRLIFLMTLKCFKAQSSLHSRHPSNKTSPVQAGTFIVLNNPKVLIKMKADMVTWTPPTTRPSVLNVWGIPLKGGHLLTSRAFRLISYWKGKKIAMTFTGNAGSSHPSWPNKHVHINLPALSIPGVCRSQLSFNIIIIMKRME